jgi:hypothetical protein
MPWGDLPGMIVVSLVAAAAIVLPFAPLIFLICD